MLEDEKLFHSKFEEIRKRYSDSLPEKLEALESVFKTAHAKAESSKENGGLPQLMKIVHKLVGSAGTFGFPSISGAASNLEKACAAIDGGLSPRSERWLEIEKLIADLKSEMDNIGDQPPDELEKAEPTIFSPSGQSKSVLLVDDDLDQAEQLKLSLAEFGYKVAIIGDVIDMAKAVEDYPPAAIIFDPEFNRNHTAGTDAVQHLRSTFGIDCPVIVTAFHDDFEARLAAVRAGYDAFLPKPVAVSDLVQLLDSSTNQEDDEPQRILIIDDDPDIIQFVSVVLQSAGMISEGLTDPTLMLEKLGEFSPELVLIDLWMPKCSGKDIAAIIRQQPKYSSLPIVFLSGETNKDLQLEAIATGGDDFLTKPIDPRHLVSAIRSRVSRFRGLRDQMVRDSMTGLFNHATTRQLLDTELERSRRSGSSLSFAMLDIDHFKSVNDTYGHGIGDEVIKNLAGILTSRLRRIDIIGRLGGEEFGVILGDTPAGQAIEVMENIRTTFENTPQKADDKEFKVTLSCGIAEFQTFDTGTTLSEAADQALYEAKNGGRNKVVLATRQDATRPDTTGPAPDNAEPGASIQARPESSPEPAPGDTKREPPATRPKKDAIVLDDDPEICSFVKLVADKAGFDVETLGKSSKFISVYRAETELIVLDLNMPDIDGIELIRFLVEKRCEAALIIISGFDREILAAAKSLAAQRNLRIIGTLSKPLDKDELKELLDIAYESSAGKPGFTTIDTMSSDGTLELPSVDDLRQAIANNELEIYFQPKVSLPEKVLVGAEALARWQHPTKGFVPPDYFIPFAEKHDLIDDLTDMVLRKICAFARGWRIDSLPFKISVNISERSLNDLDLPEKLTNIMTEGGLDPSNIILEVTETTLSADPTYMLDISTRLRLKGFQISIDDFGTGHSSLARLQQLPFNELKIDKSFVAASQTNPGSKIIVKNTIDLATSLGLKVVAEGVETQDQLDFLQAFGCNFIQGYFISRPLPPDEFERWYKSQQI